MLVLSPEAFTASWDAVRPHVVRTFCRPELPFERDARFARAVRWGVGGATLTDYIRAFVAEVAASTTAVAEADRLRYFLGGLAAAQPAFVTMINRGNPTTTSELLAQAHTLAPFIVTTAATTTLAPISVDALAAGAPWDRGRAGGGRGRRGGPRRDGDPVTEQEGSGVAGTPAMEQASDATAVPRNAGNVA